MPQIDWLPFISFILSTSLSPGPNNISSASNDTLHGVRRTLPFILGITGGIFTYLILTGLLSGWLATMIPQFEQILRIAGAGYIFWLAFKTLRASYQVETSEKPPLRFIDGLLLLFANPKVLFFGLMVFTGFLHPLTSSPIFLFLGAFTLACWIFLVNLMYASAGSAIRKYIENKLVIQAFNTFMALLLIYPALDLSGVWALIFI